MYRRRELEGRNRGPKTSLRVLAIEDSADDTALLLRELKRGGYETYSERVETPEAMRQALVDGGRWDVVIADHEMSRFSAPAALGILEESGLDLPFIVVSRQIDEDAAVEAMRAGAHDYVTKGNLARLCPAIERELGDASERRERLRSEAALRQSERLYRAVVERSSECIFLVDTRSRRVLEANEAFRELLGYTSEELEEMTLYDFVAHDRASVDENIRLLVKKGRHDIGERRYRRKDSTLVDVEVRANALLLDGQEVMCCVSRDVTERKRAEEELRKSEERFRSLVQNASDIILVLEADGTISYESPATERVLGYKPEERIETNAFDYLHPDDLGPMRSKLDELLKKPDERLSMEYRVRDKGGSWRHLEAIGSNLLHEPAIRGIVVNSRDATERKRTEESLQRSLDVLLALREAGYILNSTLESNEIGAGLLEIMRSVSGLTTATIDVLDERGELRIWRATGLERLWRRARFSPEAEAARQAVLETGEHRLFRLRRPGSEIAHLAGLCLPFRMRDRIVGVFEAYGPEGWANDETIEILGSLTDQAASALENARLYSDLAEREHRLQELVGQLFGAQEEERRHVAYEVHDGLAQMAAAAHQYLRTYARRHPPGSQKGEVDLGRVLELMQQTVGEARRIIADLRPTVLDDFGLAAAVNQEVDQLSEEGWLVEYEQKLGDERLPTAVETALFRIVQEALTNAHKHAETDQIRIELSRDEEIVRLRIRDRGRGFDPGALNTRGPGERVGLSGMRERVAALGGEFEFWSRPGAGTSISVDVPLSATANNDRRLLNDQDTPKITLSRCAGPPF